MTKLLKYLISKLTVLIFLSSAQADTGDPEFIRIMTDRGPGTLNPRRALDSIGQKMGSLLFEGLSRIDENLKAAPGLASKWEVMDQGKTWRFHIRPGLKDHTGRKITPKKIALCLENYRSGKPIARVSAGFPYWTGTRVKGNIVEVLLSEPDPYFPRNAFLLRYFVDEKGIPCEEPEAGDKIFGSGAYMPPGGAITDLTPDLEFSIVPAFGKKFAKLRFIFVNDETTRALTLLRGDADIIMNGLGLSKENWFKEKHTDRFYVMQKRGVTVAYLAFNMKDPILSKLKVRQAITMAIDRKKIVRDKLFGICTVANSFLSPVLAEYADHDFEFNVKKANSLLDAAGYPRKKDNIRFKIKYNTTPVRIGIEKALIFREMLKKIGVRLELKVLELAVFFANLRNRNYQMYSSRWSGISDGSIYYTTMYTGQPRNRVDYSNPEVDRLIQSASSEVSEKKRILKIRRVQEYMAKDLPYFPLWYWDNLVIMSKDLTGLTQKEISLSGAFDPFRHLKRVSSHP